MKKTILLCFLLTIFYNSHSQETYPVNGSFDIRPGLIAFTNANIVISADQTIIKGTLLIRGRNIEAVGENISIPKGYRTINLNGKYIYPSLIDAFTSYGFPDVPQRNLPFMAGTAATYGLTREQALATITLNVAKILGIDKTTGSLEVGKDATLFISKGEALDMIGNDVEQAFIRGKNLDLDNLHKQIV